MKRNNRWFVDLKLADVEWIFKLVNILKLIKFNYKVWIESMPDLNWL